jgi:hypothetical protein
MFKRIIWWTTGAVMGAAGSAFAQRKVKRQVKATVERYAPPAIADRARQRVTDTAYGLVDDVRDAFDEGKAAASERQAELRDRLGVGAASNSSRASAAVEGHSSVVAPVIELHPGHPSGAGRPTPPGGSHRSSRLTRLRRRG